MPNTFPQSRSAKLGAAHVSRARLGQARHAPARTRTKLDWAIIASILLMLAVNAIALFGDLGPTTAYAAVPM